MKNSIHYVLKLTSPKNKCKQTFVFEAKTPATIKSRGKRRCGLLFQHSKLFFVHHEYFLSRETLSLFTVFLWKQRATKASKALKIVLSSFPFFLAFQQKYYFFCFTLHCAEKSHNAVEMEKRIRSEGKCRATTTNRRWHENNLQTY